MYAAHGLLGEERLNRMALWLVAQIVPQRHEYAAEHVGRVGFPTFYPRWRRTYGRKFDQVEVQPLYSGYMFILSPLAHWYEALKSCSAVVAIAATSACEPLRSRALDDHVDSLMDSLDADGYLPPPRQARSKFLRGDRVHVMNQFFTGDARFLRLRSDGGAELETLDTKVPFIVRDHEVSTV